MFVSGAVWLVNMGIWCLNPYSIGKFIINAKTVNQKFDELADLADLFKLRLANTVDRVFHLDEIQKQACWYVDLVTTRIEQNGTRAH